VPSPLRRCRSLKRRRRKRASDQVPAGTKCPSSPFCVSQAVEGQGDFAHSSASCSGQLERVRRKSAAFFHSANRARNLRFNGLPVTPSCGYLDIWQPRLAANIQHR
jgi:hypothetical protein